MTRIDAFRQMVLSIATIRAIHGAYDGTFAANAFEDSFKVTENDLNEGNKQNGDTCLFILADEFVDFSFDESQDEKLPSWISDEFFERERDFEHTGEWDV